MNKSLTRLYDRDKKVFVELWLNKTQFENLPLNLILPYQMSEQEKKEVLK
jgi:hypothetical protein